MNCRPDSAQFFAALGTAAGFILAHGAEMSGSLCALTGFAYTVWKWRRESRAGLRRRRARWED